MGRLGEEGDNELLKPGTAPPPICGGGGGGGGEEPPLPAAPLLPVAIEPLFSATTLSDFSNTFHNLIVLSVYVLKTDSSHTLVSRDVYSMRMWKSNSKKPPEMTAPQRMKTEEGQEHGHRGNELRVLTICRQQEMSCILPLAPPNLVDLFFDFQRFQVIEFGFMRLEFGIEFVFAPFLGLVPFEQDDSTALVTRCQIIAGVIEFDSSCKGQSRTGQFSYARLEANPRIENKTEPVQEFIQ